MWYFALFKFFIILILMEFEYFLSFIFHDFFLVLFVRVLFPKIKTIYF